jgi:hypothetical protein
MTIPPARRRKPPQRLHLGVQRRLEASWPAVSGRASSTFAGQQRQQSSSTKPCAPASEAAPTSRVASIVSQLPAAGLVGLIRAPFLV